MGEFAFEPHRGLTPVGLAKRASGALVAWLVDPELATEGIHDADSGSTRDFAARDSPKETLRESLEEKT